MEPVPDRNLCGRTVGEFVLRERIGEGGGGAVYRCAQPLLKRDVVVKVLRHDRRRKNGAQDRFLREAQLASRLDHPYAAHVYAFGVERDDGLLWIAMELVHGITLDAWLVAHGRMPLEQFVPFFECVADVVHAAHERGIVHRDLKPSNVMVIERRGRMFPKLLDFGIAKTNHELAPLTPIAWPEGSRGESPDVVHPPGGVGTVTRTDPAPRAWCLTACGTGLGSSPYMSPEQWGNARTVGLASDIYSLGILAYKALTGRLPFTAESDADYYRQHLKAEVPPLGAGFSADLDRILRRALAKAPEARHGSALDLASDLRTALRVTERELLRSSAQQWEDKGRPTGLLWRGAVLADLHRWTRSAPPGTLSELECAFVAASFRHARRAAWLRWLAGALILTVVLGALQYRAVLQTRLAQEVAAATITQAELEQGRSALLHGEPEAPSHLAEAYRRDPSPSTAFMLARALQPRLAEQARFTSTFGRMWSAAFSPDGRQIVTTDDRSAQIWDARTYQRRLVLPHGFEVDHAVYSRDGTRLVTAARDAVRVWDPARGVLLRELTQKHVDLESSAHYMVAVSPDGGFVAAIDVMGAAVLVWDAATGANVAELSTDASWRPGLAFSSDGRWLVASGGSDARVFDTATWAEIRSIPRVRRLAFDPTGLRLVTGNVDGDVSIWEIPSGVRIRHLREVGEEIDAVAFSPDGKLVVAASRDGAEQVWQVGSGKLQSQLNARHGRVFGVEFDRTSKLVLTANGDGTVVVADAALGMPVTVLDGPRNEVRSAHFDASSRRVVGVSRDGTVRVWDASSPYRRWQSPVLSGDCGVGTTAEPGHRFLAISCANDVTRVWDTAQDRLLAALPSVSQVAGDFTSAFPAVSAAGDRAAIARGHAVEIYELPGGRLLRTVTHGAPVNAVAFATQGRDVISGAVDGSLLVTRDHGAVRALPFAAGGIDAVAFLTHGRVVASDARRRLRVYAADGAVLADLELPGRVTSLRVGRSTLVTVPIYSDSAAPPVLVDLQRYAIITQLAGHVGRVFSARWVAGDRILTAGGDGSARMWNGSTGQLVQVYGGSSRFLTDATLGPDGLVIAGGGDGVLRFWDTASGRLLWTLQAHKSYVVGVHVENGDIVTRGFTGEVARWRLPMSKYVIDACMGREVCAIVSR